MKFWPESWKRDAVGVGHQDVVVPAGELGVQVIGPPSVNNAMTTKLLKLNAKMVTSRA